MITEWTSDRRTFFKQAALLGLLGLLSAADRPALAEPKKALPQPEPSGQGYRLTEQVRKYYETAGI
jgi:hypothetical protein